MNRRARTAFTLIELLVVIGIILILIAILLPTISRVQLQARATATQQQINSIAAAIERYKQDQGQYPGPLSNASVSTVSDAGGTFTETENMVVGLTGGLKIGPTINIDEVGLGAASHNSIAVKQIRLPIYIDPTPGQMMPDKPWNPNGKTGAGDSYVPEFIDRFQTPRPILYLRARVGNPGMTATDDTSAQFNITHLSAYTKDNDFAFTASPDEDHYASWNEFLKNPQFPTATTAGVFVRGKDKFILFSAGIDGKFGTRDDIFYAQ